MNSLRDVQEESLHKVIKALEEEKSKSEAVIEAIGDGLSIQDTSFKILYMNSIAKTMFGDRVGEFCYTVYEQRNEICEKCPLVQSFKDGKIYRQERSNPTRTLHVEITASPMKDSAGEIIAGIEVVRDITARRQAEERLRESEKRYRDLFEHAHDMIQSVDPEGAFVFVNQSWLKAMGYRWDDLKRLTIFDILHPDCRGDYINTIKKALSGEEVRNIQTIFISKDGKPIHVEGNVHCAGGEKIAAQGFFRDVTERKKAEELLRTHYHFLQVLLDTIPTPIFYKDKNGLYLGCNKAFEACLGKERAQVIGKSVYDIAPRELADAYSETDMALFRQPGVQTCEGSVVYGNGTKHDVIFYKATFPTHDGRVGGLVGTILDITERKQAEKALEDEAKGAELEADIIAALAEEKPIKVMLQQSCELLVKHLDIALARMWTFNAKENMLELQASAGMYTHTDGSHSHVPIGKLKIGRIAEKRLPHLTNNVVGDPHIHDQEWAKREGVIAFAGHPLMVKDRVVGVMAMFSRHKLSERIFNTLASLSERIAVGIGRKRTEEALLEQQSVSANLIRNSAIATFVLDNTHKVMIWNKACEELTGCPESEMIGTENQWRPFYSYKRPKVADIIINNNRDSLPELYKSYSKSALNAQGVKAEGWYKNLGGKDRYIAFEASPIYNSKGDLIAAIETLQDLTESKRLEERLVQSQKIEAIGQLAGGMAHDFSNILSAIIGYAHLTLTRLPEDNLLRGNLEQILRASDRATTLTQSLLSFSRKQIMNPQPNNLNEILKRQEKFLVRLIREDIEITTRYAENEPTIFADRGQIEQVLMNLVMNARDAMPKGGHIAMRTEVVHLDEAFIEAHGYGKVGRYALLSVSDTGEGMDSKTMARIFEPFFTTKEQGKGSGLGLSMVYGIVKQHDGHIDVHSEPGRGATFKIYLPLFRGVMEEELKGANGISLQGGSETVLVAEDDATLRKLNCTVLRNYGYSVVEAIDGEDAVAKFSHNRNHVKVVMLDCIMPKKNGREVYEEIRIMNPSIKTIFVSGYAEDIISKEGLLEPGINFILKPLIPSDLLQKVREVLDA